MLTEKLQSMEQKVDKFSGELGVVRTKVDLAMMSISLIQQEQSSGHKVHQGSLEFFSNIGGCGSHGSPTGREGVHRIGRHASTTASTVFAVVASSSEFH
jgi:hypothetical protein